MIRIERIEEPASFDEEVRKPGHAWLKENPGARADQMPSYWSRCRRHLADGFRNLCGYSAMWTQRGTVDHYRSRSSRAGRELAYEWTNYRFASEEANSAKGTWDTRILDPFEVEDGWFEILLPSLDLVMVEERIPVEQRDRARFTLAQLRLGDDDAVIEIRQSWYDEFHGGDMTLQGLERRAPMIARAVDKRLARIKPGDFDDEQTACRSFLAGNITLRGLRAVAPRIAAAIDAELAKPDERVRRGPPGRESMAARRA